MRRTTAGFTLLETLVVLVILGLLATILMQGFGQAMDLRLRLGRFMDGTGQETLSAGMLRRTLQALVEPPPAADEAEGAAPPAAFRGSARALRGLSLAPLDGEVGTPSPIAWTLEREDGRTVLTYEGQSGTLQRIRSWEGDGGGFRYRDADGTWSDAWPPPPKPAPPRTAGQGPAATLPPPPALPSLIRLDGGSGAERWTLLAAPRRTATSAAPPPPDANVTN